MTVALNLVPVLVDEDGAPVAAWGENGSTNLRYMTRERARALTDTTRDLLRHAGANLVELRAGSAHLALDYPDWHSYVEAEFGDLTVYRLVKDRQQRVAERQALVASMSLAGMTVREQRDKLGGAVGTVHNDQRALGLVPDKPLPAAVADAPAADPYRGLSPKWASLAMVADQADRGLNSLELVAQLNAAHDTAHASLSKLAAKGLVVVGALEEARSNRRPYRITEAGRVKLAVVLAERDAAERS